MKDKTIIIPLSKTGKKYKGQYEAIVDYEDRDLAELNWSIDSNKRYARRVKRIDGKDTNIYLHRTILERILGRELVEGEYVDHRNGNGLDNRRSNLRVASYADNNRNMRRASHNTSGYKGARWHKQNKNWNAFITVDNKYIHLGVFDNLEDAHRAYCEAAIKYFGEFANFGDE